MRQLTLAMGLCMAITPALALDEAAPASAASSITAPASAVAPATAMAPSAATESATPVIAPVTVTETSAIVTPPPRVMECSPPPPPVETPASKLRAAQQNLSMQKVEVYRTTIKNTAPTKNLFSRLLSASSNPIDAELLQDMQRFIERYPDFPETGEVYHLMAQVHMRTDNFTAAAIDWLMLRAAYPNSPFAREASKQLQALADDNLKKHAATLKTMQAQADKLKGERDERMAEMLRYLGNNSEKDLAIPISAACASFLVSNQSWQQEDVIEHAWARQATLLDAQSAVFHYNKLLALYADSPLRPDSLLALANVQRKQLRDFDQAARNYIRLTEQYPAAPETKQGYELLGTMYDEDMRDYPNALKTYESIVAKYKDDPVVLRALRAMATIQQAKTEQPAKAIESHLRIADIFKGPEGLEALLAAERITMLNTRDWKTAISINNRIMTFAPGKEEAVAAQFNNADITENKLNDKEGALKLYNEFVAKYPNHSLTKDAGRRIENINASLNKGKK